MSYEIQSRSETLAWMSKFIPGAVLYASILIPVENYEYFVCPFSLPERINGHTKEVFNMIHLD